MNVYDVRCSELASKGLRQSWRPGQAFQEVGFKIMDPNSVEVHRDLVRNIAVCRSIQTRREDMNVMPTNRQRATQPMDGKNRSPVSDCGEIGGNDVQ